MAEIKQQSISELNTQLNQAIIDGNYALVESTARSIRKLQQAEHQAKLKANAGKVVELIETIKTSKDLAKLLKPWLKEATELVGADNACIGFVYDQGLLNAWVSSKRVKAKGASSGVTGFTKNEPKTNELLGIYGGIKTKVRFDKAEHEGSFTELYEAAKLAVDKKNAMFNLRKVLVKYHKSQS
jgi:hypothetical protein